MKITLIEAARAYEAVTALAGTPLDFSSAYALVLAKRELEPHAAFYAEKEGELILQYAVKDGEGKPVAAEPGKFELPAAELPAFQKKREELNALEAEITRRRLKTPPETIAPGALEALLPVFDFGEEEGYGGE